MGGKRATTAEVRDYYENHQEIRRARTVREAYTATGLKSYYNPALLKNGVRESCDSTGCSKSRAIVIAFDGTGSEGNVPFYFKKEAIPKVVNMLETVDLGYDPQIAVYAVGDGLTDKVPIQVGQFEADTRIISTLEDLYIEGNGGGNGGESYQLVWWVLGKHTKIDCWDLRNMPGICITFGDDKPHPRTFKREFEKVFGNSDGLEEESIDTKSVRDMASGKWLLFHVLHRDMEDWHKKQYYNGYASDNVPETWNNLLGNHVAIMDEVKYMAEIVVTMLRIQAGIDLFDALQMLDDSEDPHVRPAVRKALKDFEPYAVDDGTGGSVPII